MSTVGYARVSLTGQSLEVQIEALAVVPCDKVFSEKRSGRATRDREELARALDYPRSVGEFGSRMTS